MFFVNLQLYKTQEDRQFSVYGLHHILIHVTLMQNILNEKDVGKRQNFVFFPIKMNLLIVVKASAR